MSGRFRSVLLASLVPAVLLGGACAVAQAQSAGGRTNWSDPDTWPNRKVPVAGDKVTIGRDKEVILDVSPPALGGLSIDGKLTFANDCRPRADHRVDHAARRAGHRQRSQPPHAQRDHHLHQQRPQRRRHGRHGRPRDHDLGRNAEPARRSDPHLDQAGQHGESRQHFDRGPERRGLARRRRDRPRVDGLRSPAGRAAHDLRHQRQQDHARQEARLHALRQDHLRRR